MRTRRGRFVAIGLAVVFSLGVAGYAAAGLFVLNTGTQLAGGCHVEHATFTPANWSNQVWISGDWSTTVDATPYFMPQYEDISFPSRGDANLTIDGWLIQLDDDREANGGSALTIVGDAAYYLTATDAGPVIRRVPLR